MSDPLDALLRQAESLLAFPPSLEKEAQINAVIGETYADKRITEEERTKILAVLWRDRIPEQVAAYPFVLVCVNCDADAPDTYADAVAAGWKDITFDNAPGWYFIGVCPACFPHWSS